VAAATIQRYTRGMLARKFVWEVKKIRDRAATLIQGMGRRAAARKDAFRRRHERNSAIPIQRVFRGYIGRRKASNERDKYIFSKSQSQGIEFGRQMLLEHKLHATRLQSDVTLLSQDKMGAEELVEALLEEISSFEQGIYTFMYIYIHVYIRVYACVYMYIHIHIYIYIYIYTYTYLYTYVFIYVCIIISRCAYS
jgi:hypothetical protein